MSSQNPYPTDFGLLRTQFDRVLPEYSRTIVRRIEACAHVPPEGSVDVSSFVLVLMSRAVATERALAEIFRRGHRPGTFEELLSYKRVVINEKKPRSYSIVALGSKLVVSGHLGAACIAKDKKGDSWLGAHAYMSKWEKGTCFLAVPREKVEG